MLDYTDMSDKSISEILKRLLFEHDLKVIDLARLTNVPQPTVQRLVSGTSARPHEKSLIPIANYFDISLAQLRGEGAITKPGQADETLQELGVRRVPILGWSQINTWITEQEATPTDYPNILTDTPVSPQGFALKIKDVSMEPLFPVGTTVIFDPNKAPKDRYYVLVKLKGLDEPVFRQLLVDAGDQFIKPLSPDLEAFRMHLLNPEDDIIYGILVEAKQQYAF